MRIAIFIKNTTLHKNHGGLETQNKTLAEGLVSLGYDVVVYSPFGDEKLSDIELKGVKYKFIKAKYQNKNIIESLLNPSVKNKVYEESYKLFMEDHKKHKFDIAISQSSAGLGIIRKKEEIGIPIISIIHGTTLSEFRTLLTRSKNLKSTLLLLKDLQYVLLNYFTRQREYVLNSDKVIAVSKFVRDNIAKETGLKNLDIEVIYNGVEDFNIDLEKRENLPLALLYIGRITEDKGLFELIEIFSKLAKNHDITLKIVGNGQDLERLKNSAISLKCEDNIEFTGQVSQEEIKNYLTTSHVFVLPTKRIEGFPVTIPEAMLAGLPIVAMDMGGVGEGVFDGKTGFLIKALDFADFEKKLKMLIEDKNLRLKMKTASHEKGKELFTKNMMVKKYDEVVKGLIRL